jgi:hypothetical protein
MTDHTFPGHATLTPARALLLGTLTVGVLDIVDAFVFFGLRGVPATTILHAIASGVLGRAAFSGGTGTAALGLALHFLIAFGVVAVYHLASRRFPALARNPLLLGPIYGVLVYLVMNEIVLPLSAAATGPRPLPVLVNGLLIHAFGVGLPAALSAWAAGRRTEPAPPAVLAA